MTDSQRELKELAERIFENGRLRNKICYETNRMKSKRHARKLYRAGQLLEKVGLLDLDEDSTRELEIVLRAFKSEREIKSG